MLMLLHDFVAQNDMCFPSEMYPIDTLFKKWEVYCSSLSQIFQIKYLTITHLLKEQNYNAL